MSFDHGHPRTVPIPEVIRPLISDYLIARQFWLMKNQITSDTLFFAFNKDHGPMSGNSVRKTKKMIEEELKVKFELRVVEGPSGSIT